MNATIRPSSLSGAVQAPASKSSMQRACAAALIRNGKTVLYNPGHSEDDKAAIAIIKNLGASVHITKEYFEIDSPGIPGSSWKLPDDLEINCGESGLSLRMFVPLIAIAETAVKVNGSGSLISRPADFFQKFLPELAVKISMKKGKLPILLQGPLKPADISIDGSVSSQFLTGLLMAYSATDAKDVTITVDNLRSKPYIDLTLDVMKRFGLKTPVNRNYEQFYFGEGNQDKTETGECRYTVEADWSGAAFLLVAGAIAGPVEVRGLDLTSSQADKAIIDALIKANAAVAIEAKGIKVHPAEMSAFNFDATDCPDLFPPLVALASYCKGTTSISGVNRLVYKESNRALALWEEFGKMGVDIEVKDDVMTIHGGMPLKGSPVYSHNDHRIAMACTVAALKAGGETILEKPGAVKKSYPSFYSDLKSLGADVSLSIQFLNL